MEILISQLIALMCITAIAVLLIVFSFKEFKLRKKIELLTHLVDKGYEYEHIDLNNI